MKNTVILDFMGVIADVDYKKLISKFSLTDGFKILRIFVALKKNSTLKHAFERYQKGTINIKEFEELLSQYYPKISHLLPKMFEEFVNCTTINADVLDAIQTLREKGTQVILMSNTTPETEKLIKSTQLSKYFDGMVLSTELTMRKPMSTIYKYAIETYEIIPQNTYMIDDTQKNLDAAIKLNITALKSKNSQETLNILQGLYDVVDVISAP